MYIRRTKQDVLVDAISRLEANASNKFNFAPSSTIRSILDIIANEISYISDFSASELLNKTLDTAVGEDLDFFGVIFNTPRLGVTTNSDTTASTIKFYIDPAFNYTAQQLVAKISATVTSDYIDKINNTFTIKAGTYLYTNVSNISFITLTDVTFNSTDTYVFVNAVANYSGTSANIQSGAIVAHNIDENQPELAEIANYIFVTNIAPITNAVDRESDQNYRNRLRNALLSSSTSNEVSLRLAALSIPGVNSVEIIRYMNGLGTTGIVVNGTEPIVNIGTLRAVENICNQLCAVGEVVTVIQPQYAAFKCKLTVSSTNTTISDNVINAIKNNIINYVINIEKGGIIYNSQLIQLGFVDSSIKDININEMYVGELDIINSTVLNMYPIVPSNISCSEYEKWYTDNTLIEVVAA